MLWRLQWTPEPLGPASAPELFSEGRAMAHVAYLSETIGDHQVGQCRGTEGQGCWESEGKEGAMMQMDPRIDPNP